MKMTTNRIAATVFLMACASPAALATQACVSGSSLSTLMTATVNEGGCDYGNFRLSGWAFAGVGVFSTPVTPANILVSFGTNAAGLPDITFSGNWFVDVPLAVSNSTGLLAFSIEALNNSYVINGVGVHAVGSVSPLALNLAPTGAAAVTEIDCVGGLLDVRDPNNLAGLLPLPGNLGDIACSGGAVRATATAALSPGTNVSADALVSFGLGDNFIDVIKILSVSDLVNVPLVSNGYAGIQSVSQSFTGYATTPSEVPEPDTSALFLAGGLGLFVARRKLTGRLTS